MLLTVAELRKHLPDHPTGADYDDALRRLLEAAEAAITQVAGPVDQVTEFSVGRGAYLILNRPATSFTSITEDFDGTPVALSATDYRLSPSGLVLSRLSGGTNPRTNWYGLVRVVYTPQSDVAQREAVQVLLVQQFINYHPGVLSQTIGSWTEQFASSNNISWAGERESILTTLRSATGMVVI